MDTKKNYFIQKDAQYQYYITYPRPFGPKILIPAARAKSANFLTVSPFGTCFTISDSESDSESEMVSYFPNGATVQKRAVLALGAGIKFFWPNGRG